MKDRNNKKPKTAIWPKGDLVMSEVEIEIFNAKVEGDLPTSPRPPFVISNYLLAPLDDVLSVDKNYFR